MAKTKKKTKAVKKTKKTTPASVQLQANNQFCSVLHTSFFDKKQCDAMIKACVEELWMSGETVGGGVNKKVRHVEQQVLPINDKGWPLTRILELAKQANNARYKFDMAGFLDVDAPMIMKYVKGGHYDWHVDTGSAYLKQKERKISFSLILNDNYEGGELEFKNSDENISLDLNKGDMVTFPSFLEHRVKPVLNGTRISLVGWMVGPKY